MAWNYSVLIHGYTSAGVFYDVTIEESAPDVANNTTTLTITHKIRIMSEWGGNYEIPYNTPIYVTIDGTKYTYTPSMPTVYAGQTKTITTTTHVITHSSDGSKTAVVNCRWNDSSRSYQGETGNKSLTLTTIPRASSMTAPNGTMGSSITFTISRASSSFQHEITYSFNGHSGTAVSKTTSVKPTFTPALSTFGPWLPNATSGEIQYTLNTYSGNTKIGSATYKATLAVPSTAKIKMASTNPLTVTILNGFNNQMLAGKSQARLTATADTSSCYGATIKNYAFSIKNLSNTVVYSGNNPATATSAYMDSSTLTAAGTYTASVTVSDSRGRTASTSTAFSVTAYSIPVINSATMFRCDSSGNASDSGTYMSVKAGATYASNVSGNSLTMTVASKKNTDSSYGTAQSLTNGTVKVISGFDADAIYNVLIVASDTVGGRVEYTGTLSNVDVGIVWDAIKDNMGLLVFPPDSAGSDEVYVPTGYAFGPDGSTFSELITRAHVGSGTANDLLFTIPRTAYWDIGTSADAWNEDTAEKWLKYVTATYGSQLGTDRMVINELVAGVRHIIIGSAYDWTDVVSGMPRYCWFRVFSYQYADYLFFASNGSFGYRKMGEILSITPSSVSVPNNSVTQIATLTVGAGTWWVRGIGNWTGGSGYRMIMFENSTSPTRGLANTTPGTSATATTHELTRVVNYSSSATVTLYAWQNSGAALSVWPKIEAVRIA